MDEPQLLLVAAIGATAGFFGAIAGLGGSLFMLPLLTIVLGAEDYHLFMAAAMCVNVMISGPAAYRHYAVGAVDVRVLAWLIPPMAIAIAGGVLLSNVFDGEVLARILGVIIGCSVLAQLLFPVSKDRRPGGVAPPPEAHPLVRKLGLSATGAATGILSGLMGIGGGVVLVSGAQIVAKLPLRQAIAASSSAICITAAVGAAAKLVTLDQHAFTPIQALALAAVMGAWGILGSLLGVQLVHKVPVHILRWIVGALLLAAAVRLATATSDTDPGPSTAQYQDNSLNFSRLPSATS